MISDGFSIGHLTLSISFESEVSTNLSPTFFIDFAPVFIYGPHSNRGICGYLKESGSLQEPY